jgi:hypothetical protein
MKNFNDTIGNRTRNLPTCSAVPKRHNSVPDQKEVLLSTQENSFDS